MNALLSMVALLTSAFSSPPSGPPLPPIGPWKVDRTETMCVLSHDFATASATTTIAIGSLPLSEQFDLLFIAPKHSSNYRAGGKATITTEPNGISATGNVARITLANDKRAASRIRLKLDSAAFLSTATIITVSLPVTSKSLALPEIGSALVALRTCEDGLLQQWGIDPKERDQRMDRKPVDLTIVAQRVDAGEPAPGSTEAVAGPNPSLWVSSDDYPVEALVGEKQGDVLMLWAIGGDGRVSECRVLKSSGTPALDRASCRALTARARYNPVKDAAGNPIVTHSVGRIAWRIPH